MKKLLYIVGCLMVFSFIANPFIAKGEGEQFSGKEEDVPFSSARIFSKLVEKTGLDPNADWTSTFGPKSGDEEDVGQDLYLTVYDKVLVESERQAFKNTAGRYGLSEGELVRMSQGDYTTILDKKPGLTQEEAQGKIVEIQEQLREEKELVNLYATVKASVEINEMFANGDLEDSGFDLIHDLQIIETVLFLVSEPTDIGGGYTSSSNAGGLPLPGQATAATGSSNQGVQGSSDGQGGITNNEPTGSSTSAITLPSDEVGVDPNSCFIGDKYEQAFAAFEDKKQEDENYKDLSLQALTGSSQKPTSGSAGTTAAEGDLDLESPAFLPAKADVGQEKVKPAPADQWLKDKPCTDVLCLTVEEIKKPATSAFQDSDNCIACHVEKINDTLKDVINHTLVPSKAPGNLGESAKCKKAMGIGFSSIAMNIYTMPMPVKTPTNDDLIYGTNFEDEWKVFCETVSFFPFDECKEPKPNGVASEYVIPPSIIDATAKKELAMAPDEAKLADVQRSIDIAIQSYTIQRDAEIKKYEIAKAADEKIGFFHPLKVEMDQMNYYFLNIKDILESLHQKLNTMPGGQACTDLKNKKTCE